ncbi:MAG: SBBP repeat-containing protein, partial [Methanothermobacter sp.]
GNLTYSTYLGGSNSDEGHGFAMDKEGNIYITGYTSSTDFPVTDNAYQDTIKSYEEAFVSVFDSTGNLTYSTYLGGSNYDSARGVAVDTEGNIYITGYTNSRDFPVTDNAYQKTFKGGYDDVFVSVFDSTGNLTYSTYLGGKDSGYVVCNSVVCNSVCGSSVPSNSIFNMDHVFGITVDDYGTIYITGITSSTDFPVTDDAYQDTINGISDAFVSVFDNTGNLTYSTYLGGSGSEAGDAIAVDKKGNIYITGSTYSSDFPLTDDAYQDTIYSHGNAFLAKFSRINTNIVVSDVTGKMGDAVDLTATLTDSNGTPLADEKIIFTVNGTDLAGTTGSNGMATVSYLINLPTDQYSIKAIYNGDINYNSNENTGTLTVDNEAPVITSTSPVNGTINVSPAKTITVTFSESIKKSSNFWVQLVNNAGTEIPYTSHITGGNILVISPIDDLAESKYKLMVHTGSVTDLAGNLLAGKSFKFSVGTSPTITNTSPINGATCVSVAKNITVTFSKAIRKSKNFWVELIDSNRTAISYTSYITHGNILVINPTCNLAANTTYKLMIHTSSVTDLTGNPVTGKSFRFTTGNT